MILCSCNVISDNAVREVLASDNPPRTPHQVHVRLGCRAECGSCVRTLRKIMGDAATSGSEPAAPAGNSA
jgi:bacterioferritin-associated ferredoxin